MDHFMKWAVVAASTVFFSASALQAERQEGQLMVGLPIQPTNYNPILGAQLSLSQLRMQLYPGLISVRMSGEIEPELAASWALGEDAESIRFWLYPDLRFNDGTPIDAAYLAEYFEALKGLDVPFAETIAGWRFEAVETSEGPALDVKFDHPSPNAAFKFGLDIAAILPIHAMGAEMMAEEWALEQAAQLPSSGPYQIAEANEGNITLARNPHYHDNASVMNEGVQIVYAEEQDQRIFQRVKHGMLDIALPRTSGQAEFLKDNYADLLETRPSLVFDTLVINPNVAPFDNDVLRHAMALAFDPAQNSRLLRSSFVEPSYSMIPETLSGLFDPVQPSWMQEPYDRRVERARELMEGLGYSSEAPLQVKMLVNRSTYHERVANVAAAQWSAIHLDVQIEVMEWSDLLDLLMASDFGLARAGWGMERPIPQDSLEMLQSGGVFNHVRYENPAYDALLQEMGSTADVAELNALSVEAQNILHAEHIILPYFVRQLVVLRQPGMDIGEFSTFGALEFSEIALPD